MVSISKIRISKLALSPAIQRTSLLVQLNFALKLSNAVIEMAESKIGRVGSWKNLNELFSTLKFNCYGLNESIITIKAKIFREIRDKTLKDEIEVLKVGLGELTERGMELEGFKRALSHKFYNEIEDKIKKLRTALIRVTEIFQS